MLTNQINAVRAAYDRRTSIADDYSVGPFCRVFFFLGSDFELQTYADRAEHLRVQPSHSLWRTLITLSGDGLSFHQRYINTSLIRLH